MNFGPCRENSQLINYDKDYGLAELAFEGGSFQLISKPLTEKSSIKVKIDAKDVSLSLEKAGQSSIQNIFQCKVLEIKHIDQSQSLIRLALGKQFLLAKITRKSADTLKLKPQMQVYAQIKTAALL